MRPAFTLACVTLVQTVLLTPGCGGAAKAGGAVLREWRIAAAVGVGHAGLARLVRRLHLATAAEVKAVGQVELLFNWLTARSWESAPRAREPLASSVPDPSAPVSRSRPG